jgi:putative transposase
MELAIPKRHINKDSLGGGAMSGRNPTNRGKLGTKRHILTDKNGIPILAVIAPADRHDIKAATGMIDNAVAKRPVAFLSTAKDRRGRRRYHQHLCLDRACNSKSAKQAVTKRRYVP